MPGQGQHQFIVGHATAIVPDADQLAAALVDVHLDAIGAGVQAVLHQLLDHGSRALHHLTGRYLVGEDGRQDPDGHLSWPE